MAIRIQLLRENTIRQLQEKTNRFLEGIHPQQIKDIKLQVETYDLEGGISEYIAMVIYNS